MDAGMVLLTTGAGYLFGALSFARVITRLMSPQTDIERIVIKSEHSDETFNRRAGATTAAMVLGWRAGCLISVLDMAKICLPTLALRLLFPNEYYHLICAVAGVIGNNWPVYYRFKGGAGISAIYGGLLVIDPLGLLATALAGFVVGMLILRSMLLAFLLPMLLIIPWLWFRTGLPAFVVYAVAINILYLITLVKDTAQYIRPFLNKTISERSIMEQMPMGRGMLKMMDYMHLEKK